MDHITQEETFITNRIGFHYFLDVEQFKKSDSNLWLPKLAKINAKWLVIQNPEDRAIPEEFIRSFSDAGINLIINFNKDIKSDANLSELSILLNVYGKWGVRYAYLFEKPNLLSQWGEFKWINHNVVETYLKKFIPFAELCLENQIKPIFSPLYPGGDYWDLAFLEESLERLSNLASPRIIENLILSAFGWDWGHSIEWGSGGKKKWPDTKPFYQKQNSQNQQGFRTHEWYLEIAEKVLGKKLPVIILEAGIPHDHTIGNSAGFGALDNLSAITHLLTGKNVYDPKNPELLLSPIPSEVIGCNFFILSAKLKNDLFPYMWFSPRGIPLGPARALGSTEDAPNIQHKVQPVLTKNSTDEIQFKYRRYVLFTDALKQEISHLLERLDHYIRIHKPHIGFSRIEAANAAYILVITKNKEEFISEDKESLSNNSVIKVVSPNEIEELTSE